MAQSINESTNRETGVPGQSKIARDKNNFHGIGAFDRDPYNMAFVYSDAANGWVGYFDNIARTSVYRNKGAFDANSSYGNAVTDPYTYLQIVVDAGYASSEQYYKGNAPLISAIIKFSGEQGWASSAELAANHPEILTNAATIHSTGTSPYERSGSGTFASPFSFSYIGLGDISDTGNPNTGGITSNSFCGLGNGNGNLNATALELAWPEHGHGCTPKPEYEAAMKIVHTGEVVGGMVAPGCSCDRFVATVLKYSGADPNVPNGGTSLQLSYFTEHPNLYQEIPNLHNTSNMLPGDIMILNGHIMMYVKRDDGTEGIASASIAGPPRTGEFGAGVYFADHRGDYRIFRFIGTYNSTD